MKFPKVLAVMQLASHCYDPLSLSLALSSMAFRVAFIVFIVLVMAVLGCASLPGGAQHPVSQAVSDVANTVLAKIAAANTP
jgi:hypothetical protein